MEDKKGEKIDGTALSKQIKEELKKEVDEFKKKNGGGLEIGLAVVLVGDREDSAVYVRMKQKAAEEIGMKFTLLKIPATVTQADLVLTVQKLNADPSIHGILVQVPLPSHITEKVVLDEISIAKDVDGFHPLNIGCLAMKGRNPTSIPCTPRACMELLRLSGTQIEGAKAVVLGRSNIVGIPVALLLIHANATVTVCHSKTKNIDAICREADIIIAAIGQPLFVKKEWVKEGAVVIDVGINSVESKDPKRPPGSKRLVGDVDYNQVIKVAGKITPVPGGVGPMTVTMLLRSTLDCAKRSVENKSSSSEDEKH